MYKIIAHWETLINANQTTQRLLKTTFGTSVDGYNLLSMSISQRIEYNGIIQRYFSVANIT